MYNEEKDKRSQSLIIFIVIVFLGSMGLFLKHSAQMKINTIVIKEQADHISETCLRDSSYLEVFCRKIFNNYKDTIFIHYYPEDHAGMNKKPLYSEYWFDSCNGKDFLIAQYDLVDEIRALSVIGIKNDSLVSVNAFRRGGMIPYTFGPLARMCKEVF
ncbi:MAG: hypothetical protein U5N56_08150 [Candidatus Marinimicrobia bacterium]|nr:hypothetical protein [Candidatus Neomarinimicrobiota bacterium]